jgi:hypothetical protein
MRAKVTFLVEGTSHSDIIEKASVAIQEYLGVATTEEAMGMVEIELDVQQLDPNDNKRFSATIHVRVK